MSSGITREQLVAELDAGHIVPLTITSWSAVSGAFRLVSEVATGMGGVMLLVRRPLARGRRLGWALVEEPKPGEKVVRPLANEKEARALIKDRLAAYERMWDG